MKRVHLKLLYILYHLLIGELVRRFESNGVLQAPNMHMSFHYLENGVQDSLSVLFGKCPMWHKEDLQSRHILRRFVKLVNHFVSLGLFLFDDHLSVYSYQGQNFMH
jgi:hypothetical protein